MDIPNTSAANITHERSGINWHWVWYKTEEAALAAVKDATHPRTSRDRDEDNEHGYCVAFHL